MTSERENYSDLLSRRRFVELAGVSGAAALAGCGGDSDGNGDNETGNGDTGTGNGGDTNVVDQSHMGGLQANPTERTLNNHHTQLASEPARRLTMDRFIAYSFGEEEFIPAAVEEWDIQPEEEVATLTFRDDLTWSDGSDATTEDVDVQFQIMEKVGSAVFDFVDDWEAVDEQTFELTLSGQTNPRLIEFQLSNLWLDTPAAAFGDLVEEDAATIQEWMWEEEGDVITSGPFQYVDRNQQQWNFERNDDWRNIENVNFTEYNFDSYEEAQAPQQDFATGADRFDSVWSMFAPPNTVDTFGDSVVEHRSILAKWGYGVVFNHDHDIFGDRAVRQAVAYIVNRQEVVNNAGERTKFPSEVPCGIAPKDIDTWLGDTKGEFNTYGVDETDTESATQVLEEAGYEMDGETWVTPDGDPVSADYLTPSGWSDFTTSTETIVDRLNEFGFDMTVSTQPTSDWQGSIIDSNFGIAAFYWLPGQARSTFPYFPLRHQLVFDAMEGGHNYPADEEQTITGMDGEDMTLTPADKVAEIASQPTEEDARPIVQEAAWHNNVELPFLSLMSKYEQSWMTDDEWDIDESEPQWSVKWPVFWLPRRGQLSASE